MLETAIHYQPSERKETSMQKARPTFSEALLQLAKKRHYSDRDDTLKLARMIADGLIAIEQIEPLDIQ